MEYQKHHYFDERKYLSLLWDAGNLTKEVDIYDLIADREFDKSIEPRTIQYVAETIINKYAYDDNDTVHTSPSIVVYPQSFKNYDCEDYFTAISVEYDLEQNDDLYVIKQKNIDVAQDISLPLYTISSELGQTVIRNHTQKIVDKKEELTVIQDMLIQLRENYSSHARELADNIDITELLQVFNTAYHKPAGFNFYFSSAQVVCNVPVESAFGPLSNALEKALTNFNNMYDTRPTLNAQHPVSLESASMLVGGQNDEINIPTENLLPFFQDISTFDKAENYMRYCRLKMIWDSMKN